MAAAQRRQSTSSRADSSTTTSSIPRAIETKDIPLKTKICMRMREKGKLCLLEMNQ